MIFPILILTLSFVAVAALLLSLNLATGYSAWIKVAAVVIVTALYGGTWFAYQDLLGWASPAPLPEKFRVHWITMDDPDKVTGEPGTIYFWVRELDSADLPVGAPRVHRIPWDEDSAEAAQQALEQLEEGELLNGRRSRNLVSEEEESEMGADYAGDRAISGEGGQQPSFEFIRVPPPSLPAKLAPAIEPVP